MNLTSIVLTQDRSEKQTFECPRCELVETRVVTDPLASEAVRRLTNNIRPPA
jgi:hypothetical protein